jgi:hypothetical protein
MTHFGVFQKNRQCCFYAGNYQSRSSLSHQRQNGEAVPRKIDIFQNPLKLAVYEGF